MTGYGFTGPMTARGTVFEDKEERVFTFAGRRGMLARGRHRVRGRRLWWLVLIPAQGF